MLGYGLALVWTEGISMLLVLPSLAAFLVMVTALTYQLQGWLASLMSDPRRRRTVVVVTTMVFVLLVQLPNMINFIALRNVKQRDEPGQGFESAGQGCQDLARRSNRSHRASHPGNSTIPNKRRTERAHQASRTAPCDGREHRANGSAREFGPADRLAPSGGSNRRRGACRAGRSWGSWE